MYQNWSYTFMFWTFIENTQYTVYPKKYAHGFVVLWFVVVMQSFIMNSHEAFIHIHQGCFAGTGAIVRLPQCQWSKPDGYGKISQCITTTKHSKAKTVCIYLGIYCIYLFHILLETNRRFKSFSMGDEGLCGSFQLKDGLSMHMISIIKISRSWDCLIFMMGILILVRRCLLWRRGPGHTTV